MKIELKFFKILIMKKFLRAKIQYAVVKEKNLKYDGSITIDRKIMDEAGIFPNEVVLVVNVNTGVRFETYVIEGKENSGIIGLNGGAARLGEIGDELIIMSFEYGEKPDRAKVVILDENNRIKEIREK